jgi:hypothetical protein
LTCHKTYGASDLYLVDRDVTFDIKSLFESGRNVARSGRLQRSRAESFSLSTTSLVDRGLLRLSGGCRKLLGERGGFLGLDS